MPQADSQFLKFTKFFVIYCKNVVNDGKITTKTTNDSEMSRNVLQVDLMQCLKN